MPQCAGFGKAVGNLPQRVAGARRRRRALRHGAPCNAALAYRRNLYFVGRVRGGRVVGVCESAEMILQELQRMVVRSMRRIDTSCVLVHSYTQEKAKPAARRGRKATDLAQRQPGCLHRKAVRLNGPWQ